MRSIVMTVMLIFISELAYATMAPNDPILEEQNGKLMFPILDPKTGKYTFNVERGKKIIELRS